MKRLKAIVIVHPSPNCPSAPTRFRIVGVRQVKTTPQAAFLAWQAESPSFRGPLRNGTEVYGYRTFRVD